MGLLLLLLIVLFWLLPVPVPMSSLFSVIRHFLPLQQV
jgi:hypothetical protein